MKLKEKIRSEVLKSARKSRKLLKKESKVTKQPPTKMNPLSFERSAAGANSRRHLKKQ
ncbi:hypothetical protein [Nitrosopumilus sp. b1]|uniref:hypothetical protein n=1 Tax=Nitrosopumilus sp. b1 TaxID=2109907 RepID=UPI0015F56809|nr:hypothetical protein [Nitrosopumilus sp. b1]